MWCQPGRLCWQRQALPVPDICAAAGDEPGRWPRASGEWPGAAQSPSTANCSSLPCSRPRRWGALFWGGVCLILEWFGEGRGALLHPLIDRGLLPAVAACVSGVGSSSRSAASSLCCFRVSRGLARLIRIIRSRSLGGTKTSARRRLSSPSAPPALNQRGESKVTPKHLQLGG